MVRVRGRIKGVVCGLGLEMDPGTEVRVRGRVMVRVRDGGRRAISCSDEFPQFSSQP